MSTSKIVFDYIYSFMVQPHLLHIKSSTIIMSTNHISFWRCKFISRVQPQLYRYQHQLLDSLCPQIKFSSTIYIHSRVSTPTSCVSKVQVLNYYVVNQIPSDNIYKLNSRVKSQLKLKNWTPRSKNQILLSFLVCSTHDYQSNSCKVEISKQQL